MIKPPFYNFPEVKDMIKSLIKNQIITRIEIHASPEIAPALQLLKNTRKTVTN